MKLKSAILLTGGYGTRLAPFTTKVANKHLYPIDEKLVLDYSINTVRKLGIENLTVVLGGDHFSQIVDVLQDGQDIGLKINYVYQRKAGGIAQAINLCKPFVNDERFAVVLGDNIFQKPIKYNEDTINASIFLSNSPHIDLHHFGVLSVYNGVIMNFEEKPSILASGMDNYAITGAYVFNQKYFEIFKKLSPSARGEYEIVDIIKEYSKLGELDYSVLDGWWSDAGQLNSVNKVRELTRTEPVEF